MNLFRFLFLLSALTIISCNNNKKEEAKTETSAEPAASDTKASTTNNIKEYKVKFESDTAMLGKDKTLLLTLKSATAVALQDPDGKDLGTELSIKLTLTNKAQIGKGSSEHVDYTESRLQLDNGTSITADTGTDYLRADPEATSKEETWTYKLPAGTKSKTVSFFKDETRVTVGVTFE